jgi:large subunit ribosomal protein L15
MSDKAAEEPAAKKGPAGSTGARAKAAAKPATAKSAAGKTSAAADKTDKPGKSGAAAGKSAARAGGSKSAGSKSAESKAGAGKASGGEAAPVTGAARTPTLRPHHLRPAPGAHKPKTRKGRGEASKGKTAGRGTKGTRARDTIRPGFEGGQMPLIRRLPKLKGFSNPFREEYQVVNLDRLADLYPKGGEVTPEDLAVKGAVRAGRPVKILGTGDVSAALRVKAHAFSASAREKITAAGGAAEEV